MMVTSMENNDIDGRCGNGGKSNSVMLSMLSMQIQQQTQNQLMKQQMV